jgi:hypothetical protein
MIYEVVFETIRALLLGNPILLMKDCAGAEKLQRRLSFDAIATDSGETEIIPRTGPNVMFYRGQGNASRSACIGMLPMKPLRLTESN